VSNGHVTKDKKINGERMDEKRYFRSNSEEWKSTNRISTPNLFRVIRKILSKILEEKKIRNLMNISCEYISRRTLASSTEYFKND